MANSQAPAHWSKDFVEHLRAVHFTLIALCVGLIVLASFPSKTEIQIAHEQALEILEATNSSSWRDAIEVEALRAIKTAIPPNELRMHVVTEGPFSPANFMITYLNTDLNDTSSRPYFAFPSWIITGTIPDGFLSIPSQLQRGTVVLDNEGKFGLQLRVPKNLKSFAALWDASLAEKEIVVPKIPNLCFTSYPETDLSSKRHWTECKVESAPPPKPDEWEQTFIFRVADNSDAPPKRDWSYEFANVNVGSGFVQQIGEIRLPASKFSTIKFDEQVALIQCATKWNQKHKLAFKDAFRELATVYGPMENADIGTAERILDAEAKRTGDAFEAAGLKIPAEVAVRCGVLLVLGVQLYMLIHLREFGNRLDREAGFAVAWIGVYSSRLARVMLFVSLLLLPACTIVLLSIRGLAMTEHKRIAWTALVLSNAASLAFSYLIFRASPEPPALASPTIEHAATNAEQSESDAPAERHFE